MNLDWLASTFDLGRPLGATVAGQGQNSPFGLLRLQTSRGIFSVKRLPHAPSPVALAVETAAHTAGFPMPQPMRTAQGELAAACISEGRPAWVRVYTWVEGTSYDWGTVDPAISATLGGLLAALHAVPMPQASLQEEPWTPLGPAGWEHLLAQAIAQRVAWVDTLRQTIPALLEWEQHVLASTVTDEPLVPSQRDLHPPNVIRRPDGTHAVVDWDGAGSVSAREDTATFALVWAGDFGQPASGEAVRAFIRGYREAGGRFESRGILDLTQRMRGLLAWIAYNVTRDVGNNPGPLPDLTAALLSGIRPLDLEALQRTAALLEQA